MSLEEDYSEGASSPSYHDEGDGEDDGEGNDENAGEMGRGSRSSGEFRVGAYNATEVNDQVFEELALDPEICGEMQHTWRTFLQSAESRDAAGEAIYAALFDAAPSLQAMFKTPRAVMAMRFMNGINTMVSRVNDPKSLKIDVETLGFQHLDLEVTAPRVVIFRDAIVDLLETEAGAALTPRARNGWCTFLNYIGGSYIYVRVQYAERLQCLSKSWAQANGKGAGGESGEADGNEDNALPSDNTPPPQSDAKKSRKAAGASSWFSGKSRMASGGHDGDDRGKSDAEKFQNTSVPKNYRDMFHFNAAVMGFGNQTWLQEVLASFDAIVMNVSNSYRLQEECDVLSLRMASYRGDIQLGQYKSVMLASLRSLVRDWGSLHEVSWSWLWENVERLLKALLGKPAAQQTSLALLLGSLDENSLMFVRREVYSKFFALAPGGQDFFKQSTTRLHFIADKLVAMTLDMYREPQRMVEDISAMGLRHVGYGIPTDLFGPFVTACVQVVRMLTDDDAAEESFRWSLGLISRILVRVITEGSTIVMKAINANSGKQLRRAVACAPRGQRALWMLNVQVGTQSISPLLWAIETGSLDAAKAMLFDLLTIRADRDRYYYGNDIMFERHPDIVKRLCLDAPALLPVLLDGLVWRSRVAEGGQRRVNYYVKRLIVDDEGEFAPATLWIVEHSDPKVVCHPVVAMVTDLVWSRVAFRTFLFGRTWFMFTLIIFVLAQAVLNRIKGAEYPVDATDVHGSADFGAEEVREEGSGLRVAVFVCRLFVYICSLGQSVFRHSKLFLRDCRNKAWIRIGPLRIPAYLRKWQDVAGLCLMAFLIMMCVLEPTFHCIGKRGGDDRMFSDNCAGAEHIHYVYSLFASAAMLLYFILLSDIAVLSTRVSAFVLVCIRVLSEVGLFLCGLTFLTLGFACAISSLEQHDPNFDGIPGSLLSLYMACFGMLSGHKFDALLENPALMVGVVMFMIMSVVFLTNLLIAQLSCSYHATYQDMVGYARLSRGKIVCETMPGVSRARWASFVESLKLEERVEFGEGDVGLAGGITVWEAASANPTTKETIRRFGGSTSPAAQWPAEDSYHDDESDRFERMERLIERAMKRLSGGVRRKGASAHGGSSVDGGSSMEESGMMSVSQ